jgi:protoporphyrinogen oxidase
MSQTSDVLVVGAGPAGLTAAYLLTKRGMSVTVIEADPDYVGGLSRTVNYKGFLFDIGGHRFFSKSREIVELWQELLPDGLIERRRLSRILYDGKFYSYPLKALDVVSNLGPLECAACACSYFYRRLKPVREPRTLHDWVANEFGERLFSIFFKTYTEKVWGMSCDDISADWAAQRIKDLNLWRAVKDAMRRSLNLGAGGNGAVVKTLIETFRYPRRGPGMMWAAAAAAVRSRGGAIHMGQTLARLHWDAARRQWRVEARKRDGSTVVYRANHVISSAPIPKLVTALEPNLTNAAAAERLRYREFIMVGLILKRADLFPDNWIYVHDPNVKVGRIQNFRAWSADMVPEPNFTGVGLEYFCFKSDRLWSEPDEALISLAKQELQQIGLAGMTDVVVATSSVKRRPIRFTITGTSRAWIRFAASWLNDIRRCTSSAATACTNTTTRITP